MQSNIGNADGSWRFGRSIAFGFGALLMAALPTPAFSQDTPESLAALWINAIKANSSQQIVPLIHPLCSREKISPVILERIVSGEVPATVSVETSELGPKDALEKIFEVVPELQLNLKFETQNEAEKQKYGLGKGFPIARHMEKWFFVVCTK